MPEGFSCHEGEGHAQKEKWGSGQALAPGPQNLPPRAARPVVLERSKTLTSARVSATLSVNSWFGLCNRDG